MQDLSAALSTHTNTAYQTLLQPLARATYLLERHAPELAPDETDTVDDVELVMEVMEARQTLEDADASEQDEVEAIEEKNKSTHDLLRTYLQFLTI